MLLSVLLHLLLDEAKRAIDDLLVQFKLGLLLVQVFLRPSDFDRVEVEQLILLLEDFEESLGLHALVENLILDAARQLDLLLVLGLHHLCLLLHCVNLVVQDLNLVPCLLFFLSDRLFHIEVLLHFLGDKSVELLYLPLVRFILCISLLNNLVLLGNLGARQPIFLLVDRFNHFFNCLNGCVSGFEPFAVRVLERIQVCVGGPHALLGLCDHMGQLLRVLLEEVQLLNDLSFFLGKKLSLVRIDLILELARGYKQLVICIFV